MLTTLWSKVVDLTFNSSCIWLTPPIHEEVSLDFVLKEKKISKRRRTSERNYNILWQGQSIGTFQVIRRGCNIAVKPPVINRKHAKKANHVFFKFIKFVILDRQIEKFYISQECPGFYSKFFAATPVNSAYYMVDVDSMRDEFKKRYKDATEDRNLYHYLFKPTVLEESYHPYEESIPA